MGKTIFQSCSSALKEFRGQIITFNQLEAIIIRDVGGQQGTISQALKVMATTGLIKDIGNSRFEVL